MSFIRDRIQSRDIGSPDSMNGLMLRGGLGMGSTAGQNVNNVTVATIPAVHRAFRFGANTIAMLSMGVYRKGGMFPTQVSSTWQARLLNDTPSKTQDGYRFWYTVQASLEARWNAYVWKTKDASGKVVALTALHPNQVFPYVYKMDKGQLQYPVLFSPYYPRPPEIDGYGIMNVTRDTIWHIRGDGGIGEQVPMTPIQTFAQSLGVALAKQDYEANLYENGVMGGLGVTFPSGMTPQQAAQWKELFDSDNAGTSNSGKTKVIGGGGVMAQIGMTPKDAQFVESGQMSLIDVCNMTGAPRWVLNCEDKTDKAKPEQDEQRLFHHYTKPRIKRICSSLLADDDLFGEGSLYYPMFDTQDTIHPDSETADAIAHARMQDGRIMADEWRIPNGLPPLPGGVGSIPQVTPVGGAPNAGTPKPMNGEDDA